MYYSPLHLTEHYQKDQQSFETTDLYFLKSRLSDELRYNPLETVEINGVVFGKEQLSALLDELNDHRKLHYHTVLFRDKVLLEFLERGVIGKGSFWLPEPLYDDPGFIGFISPYFAQAYDRLLQTTIEEDQSQVNYSALLKNKQLLEAEYQRACFIYAEKFYDSRKKVLNDLQFRLEHSASDQREARPNESPWQFVPEQVKPVTKEEFENWCSNEQILLLNMLPEHFDDTRFHLAKALNNISVAAEKIGRRDLGYAVLLKAELIKTVPDLMQRIRANREIFYKKLYAAGGPAKGNHPGTLPDYQYPDTVKSHSNKTIIWTVVVVVILCIRLISCVHKYQKMEEREAYNKEHYQPVEEVKITEENVAAMKSYYSLLAALGKENTLSSERSEGSFQVKKPFKTGEDVFSSLWKNAGLTTNKPTYGSSAIKREMATVKIQNTSKHPVIALFLKDDISFGSAYVAPGEYHYINYTNRKILVVVYTGKDWSGSQECSFLKYEAGNPQTYSVKGGFSDPSISTPSYGRQNYSSFLQTGAERDFSRYDAIVISDRAGNDNPVFEILRGGR